MNNPVCNSFNDLIWRNNPDSYSRIYARVSWVGGFYDRPTEMNASEYWKSIYPALYNNPIGTK